MILRNVFVAAVVVVLCEQVASADLFVVNSNGADTISRLDSNDGTILNTFPTPTFTPGFPADGLAFSGDALFYTHFFAGSIFELDAETGAVLNSFGSPGSIDALAYGSTGLGPTLFGLAPDLDTIFLMDPLTGTVLSSLATPVQFVGGMDFNDVTGTLFVTDSSALAAPRAYELDPLTGMVLDSIPLNFTSFGLGFDDGRLFVSQISGPYAGSILELDVASGSILHTFAAPTEFPTGLAGGSLAAPVGEPVSIALFALSLGIASLVRRRERSG